MSRARVWLAMLVAAAALSAVGTAQPPKKSGPRGDDFWAKFGGKLEYTAFPELKPPGLPGVEEPNPQSLEGIKAAREKFDKAMEELVYNRLRTELPKNPTPLQQVRHEQVRSAIMYLTMTREVIRIGRWDPAFFNQYLTTCVDAAAVAAESATTTAGRVGCFEARVVLLKDFERFTRLRVEAGSDPPQNLALAAFRRLEAEADLLKLKAEVEKGGK